VQLGYVGDRNLQITAKEAGTSVVRYTLRDGSSGELKVTVTRHGGALGNVERFLSDQLQEVIGTEVYSDQALGKVIVRGRIRSLRDMAKVRRILDDAEKNWPGLIFKNLEVRIDVNAIQNHLLRELQSIGVDGASASFASDLSAVAIGGTAYSSDAIEKATRKAEELLKRMQAEDVAIENRIKLTDAIIEVEFRQFFFTDNLQKDIGADLMNRIGLKTQAGATWGSGQFPQYTATLGIDLGKVINFLADNGYVSASKVMAVRAQNGKQAEGKFGDKIVIIPRATGGGTQADYKEVNAGFHVLVTPEMKASSLVRLVLNMKVDAFGGYTGQGDALVKENQVTTVLDIPLNHSAVLAVHRADEVARGNTGTPVLRHIPVINWIFGRSSDIRLATYTGLIVVPRVAETRSATDDPVTRDTEEIMKEIQKRVQRSGN